MSFLTYHASFRRLAPAQLLKNVMAAEQAGFGAIHVSDPSEKDQREFSFTWLATALRSTKLPFTVACTPNLRYGLPNIAREMATLGELFPARFDLAISKTDDLPENGNNSTNQMPPLEETASFIRKSLSGEYLTYDDGNIQDKVKVHTPPRIPTLLFYELSSVNEVKGVAKWADGLIADGDDLDEAEKIVREWKRYAGASKPFFIKINFSYGANPEEAVNSASEVPRDEFIPAQNAGENIPPYSKIENKGKIKLFTSIADLLQWIEPFKKMEASRIILNNLHDDQEFFINAFGLYHKAYEVVVPV